MKHSSVLHKLVAVAAICSASFPSHALLVPPYTSENDFLTAVSAPGTDDFSSLSGGLVSNFPLPPPLPLALSAGAYGYNATVSKDNATLGEDTLFVVESGAEHWLSTNKAVASITFDISSAGVMAIGGFFFGIDDNEDLLPNIQLKLTATDSEGSREETLTFGTASPSFLGFVSNGQLLSLTITAIQPPGSVVPTVYPTVSSLTLASPLPHPVPEPESYTLALAGLGLMALRARRRT